MDLQSSRVGHFQPCVFLSALFLWLVLDFTVTLYILPTIDTLEKYFFIHSENIYWISTKCYTVIYRVFFCDPSFPYYWIPFYQSFVSYSPSSLLCVFPIEFSPSICHQSVFPFSSLRWLQLSLFTGWSCICVSIPKFSLDYMSKLLSIGSAYQQFKKTQYAPKLYSVCTYRSPN